MRTPNIRPGRVRGVAAPGVPPAPVMNADIPAMRGPRRPRPAAKKPLPRPPKIGR